MAALFPLRRLLFQRHGLLKVGQWPKNVFQGINGSRLLCAQLKDQPKLLLATANPSSSNVPRPASIHIHVSDPSGSSSAGPSSPQVPLPDDVRKWSKEHVGLWLQEKGLEKYKETFLENEIDGRILFPYSDFREIVNDLGITGLSAKRIAAEIEALKEEYSENASLKRKKITTVSELVESLKGSLTQPYILIGRDELVTLNPHTWDDKISRSISKELESLIEEGPSLSNDKNDQPLVILSSPSGNGKSYTLHCIANYENPEGKCLQFDKSFEEKLSRMLVLPITFNHIMEVRIENQGQAFGARLLYSYLLTTGMKSLIPFKDFVRLYEDLEYVTSTQVVNFILEKLPSRGKAGLLVLIDELSKAYDVTDMLTFVGSLHTNYPDRSKFSTFLSSLNIMDLTRRLGKSGRPLTFTEGLTPLFSPLASDASIKALLPSPLNQDITAEQIEALRDCGGHARLTEEMVSFMRANPNLTKYEDCARAFIPRHSLESNDLWIALYFACFPGPHLLSAPTPFHGPATLDLLHEDRRFLGRVYNEKILFQIPPLYLTQGLSKDVAFKNLFGPIDKLLSLGSIGKGEPLEQFHYNICASKFSVLQEAKRNSASPILITWAKLLFGCDTLTFELHFPSHFGPELGRAIFLTRIPDSFKDCRIMCHESSFDKLQEMKAFSPNTVSLIFLEESFPAVDMLFVINLPDCKFAVGVNTKFLAKTTLGNSDLNDINTKWNEKRSTLKCLKGFPVFIGAAIVGKVVDNSRPTGHNFILSSSLLRDFYGPTFCSLYRFRRAFSEFPPEVQEQFKPFNEAGEPAHALFC